MSVRLGGQASRNYYLQVLGIVKGLAVANMAATTVYLIDQNALGMTRVLMMVAGLLAMLLTFAATLFGTELLNRPPDVLDLALPFLVGISEFLLFSMVILKPAHKGLTGWFVVLSIWAALGGLTAFHVRKRLDLGAFERPLRRPVHTYMRSLCLDSASASSVSVLAVVFAVVVQHARLSETNTSVVVGAFAVALVAANIIQIRARSRFVQSVTG